MTEKEKDQKEKQEIDVSKLSLAEKIARATGAMGAIKKNGTNQDQNWSFITEADIKASIRRVMPEYGFAIFPKDIQIVNRYERKTSRGTIWYFYDILQIFTITDGKESIDVKAMGTGSDNGDKALNKAMTIAFKNMEKQLFNVSDSHDEDPDAQTVPSVNYQQSNYSNLTQQKRQSKAKPNYKQLTDEQLQNYTVMYKQDADSKPMEFKLLTIYTMAMTGDEIAQSWIHTMIKKLKTPEGQAVAQFCNSKYATQIKNEIEKKKAVEVIKEAAEKSKEEKTEKAEA